MSTPIILKDPDMHGCLGITIFVSGLQRIIDPAQILQQPFRPVVIIQHLKLQIQQQVVDQLNFRIHDIRFLVNRFPQNDRIAYCCCPDFLLIFVKDGTDQAFQGCIVFLAYRLEHVVICHRDRQRTGLIPP